jgi:glycosyltransferase involved in cell wall biosynthesis
MRVLMFAIRYDTTDWATGFIPVWARRLAYRVDALDVVALSVGNKGEVPSNMRVYSMGKGFSGNKAWLLFNFYRHALRLVPRADAVFVHMIPRYALLALPVTKLWRKPLSLWYTHREPSPDLQRALPFVNQVLTAVDSSFPLETNKLRVLGHGIDTNFYTPAPTAPLQSPPQIVQVARLQPIKSQDKLIAAVAQLPDARAIFIGAVDEDEDGGYAEGLRVQAAPLGRRRVVFAGGQPATGVRRAYQGATVAVNLSPPGLFDKAALESMACGLPTIVANPAFDDLLGDYVDLLWVAHPVDPDELAAKLRALLALSLAERATIGAALRERVIAAHSLNTLIPRLAWVLRTGEVIEVIPPEMLDDDPEISAENVSHR